MRFILALAMLILSASLSFADGAGGNAVDSLTAVNERFNEAAAAHNAEALVKLYDKDTLWIAQGAPVSQGLKGPRELFEFVTSNKGRVVHTIDHLFVSDDASLAVMIGSVEAVIESKGMDATGTYLFVLKPEDDGWEIVTDMWHQHTQQ